MASLTSDPQRKTFFRDRYVTKKLGQDRELMDRVMQSLGKQQKTEPIVPTPNTAKAGLKMPKLAYSMISPTNAVNAGRGATTPLRGGNMMSSTMTSGMMPKSKMNGFGQRS